MNLLTETCDELTQLGRSPANIVYIGSNDTAHACTWAEYVLLADVEYDASYGAPEVAEDLVIVFDDNTWLSRHEYDGSEHWVHNMVPAQLYAKTLPIKRLAVTNTDLTGWVTLAELEKAGPWPDPDTPKLGSMVEWLDYTNKQGGDS